MGCSSSKPSTPIEPSPSVMIHLQPAKNKSTRPPSSKPALEPKAKWLRDSSKVQFSNPDWQGRSGGTGHHDGGESPRDTGGHYWGNNGGGGHHGGGFSAGDSGGGSGGCGGDGGGC
ncbi:hypothetical protein HBI38_150740 [Parastagonospora nodorum]|nr:hypothetical protein HBI02_141820 [Parastagonospora nodorum]KAH4491001.1 hypothetical protein HBH88_115770 [Parastagonospora nodorum]KAH4645244.1 hypothetical protein HBH80_242590 [Parastagonospora nodorum]KAH4675302.1 hypothetical protein HBH78_158760 [Parastagonospora nodorum]KAH4985075.1 hypothetical protein HBI76_133170 [Parastagonospora nodorum]